MGHDVAAHLSSAAICSEALCHDVTRIGMPSLQCTGYRGTELSLSIQSVFCHSHFVELHSRDWCLSEKRGIGIGIGWLYICTLNLLHFAITRCDQNQGILGKQTSFMEDMAIFHGLFHVVFWNICHVRWDDHHHHFIIV